MNKLKGYKMLYVIFFVVIITGFLAFIHYLEYEDLMSFVYGLFCNLVLLNLIIIQLLQDKKENKKHESEVKNG